MTTDAKTRPMTNLTAGQALSVARKVARDAMPYFGAGVLSLVAHETPGLGTLAVTDKSVLLYDPETIRRWSPVEAGTVILHEYLHVFFDHARRRVKLEGLGVVDRSNPEHLRLWNWACDAELNDNLQEAGLPFPKGPNGEEAITPQGLGLPPHKLAEEYYVLLQKGAQKRPQGGGKGKPQGGPGGSSQDGAGASSKSAAGCGHCGSGAGRPVPQEGDTNVKEVEGRSPVDQEVQRKADAEAIKHYGSQGQGRLPTGLKRYADERLAPPKVPWQQRLARMTRQAIAYRPGAVDYTRSRPSRRQGGMSGLGADQPILPALRQPVVNIAVVMDTSGSMGDAELSIVLSECEGIFRAQAGAQVAFCACDAKVHSLVKVRSVSEIRRAVKGGGGTDFTPAFAALDAMKPRPEVVIFATDGFGPSPAHPPRGQRVIWLIVPGGHNACPWGEVIEMGDPP